MSATSIAETMNNDNVATIKNNNVNERNNDNVSRTSNQVDAIADRIMVALHADQLSRPFYCKVAWKLSEAIINNNLEQALKGNNPQRYFTWLCKRYMV